MEISMDRFSLVKFYKLKLTLTWTHIDVLHISREYIQCQNTSLNGILRPVDFALIMLTSFVATEQNDMATAIKMRATGLNIYNTRLRFHSPFRSISFFFFLRAAGTVQLLFFLHIPGLIFSKFS